MSLGLLDVVHTRAVVLDGGLATRLEERGHDLSDDLWSARLLMDRPDEVASRRGQSPATYRAFDLLRVLARTGRLLGDLT